MKGPCSSNGCHLCLGHSHAPQPIRYVFGLEDVEIHTPSHRIHSHSHFDVTFSLHNHEQQIKLKLEPNHDVLAEDAQINYLNPDGSIGHSEPINHRDHRVFKGTSWTEIEPGHWIRVGWARLYVTRDGPQPLFEGAFSLMHDYHNVKLRSSYMKTWRDVDALPEERDDDYMVVFRNSDMVAAEPEHTELKRSLADASCQADKLDFNSDPEHPVFKPPQSPNIASMPVGQLFGLSRRQSDTGNVGGNTGGINLASTIGNTAGCPTTKKVALIGVVSDCSFNKQFTTEQDARSDIIQMVNTASTLYENTFNISLGLKNLVVNNQSCDNTDSSVTPWNVPCSTGNITSRLDDFTKWRGEQNDTNAYWTLMSSCSTGAEVGVSWLGQLCVHGDSNSSVAGANVVVKTSTEWQVFAYVAHAVLFKERICAND